MATEFDNRTPRGDRRYPNGERMPDQEVPFEEETSNPADGGVRGGGRFVPAIALVAIGGIFLLNNLGLIHFSDVWRYWPILLIVAGLRKLWSQEPDAKGSATVFLAVGAIFLLSNLGLLHVGWGLLWPAALVGAGLLMLTKDWSCNSKKRGMTAASLEDSNNVVNSWAVFSGVTRLITSQNFQGGNLFASFGGVEIDLRRAGILNPNRPVVIDANAVFGGISIKVPDTWRVSVRGSGIFGGYQDESLSIRQSDPRAPLLVVSGYAVFGGVVIE